MTKLSITLASVALSLAYAPAALAYSIEPASDMLHQIIQGAPHAIRTEKLSNACIFESDADLASLLGLPAGLAIDPKDGAQTALACAGG